jgi:hypothetical protein
MARRPLIALAPLAAFLSCSGGGLGGGCSCLPPIPGGHYQGPKTDDPIAVRLSSAGIASFNKTWPSLINSISDGGVFHVPVPCSVISAPVLGDFVIADQGTPGCSSTSCGYMDGKCDSNPASSTYDFPADVPIRVTGFSLAAQPPDSVVATVQVAINTAPIDIDTVDRNYAACLFLSPARCTAQFQSSRENPSYNQFSATVQLTIDTKWDKLLAFKITALNGIGLCGGPNVPPPPNCLDPNAVNLSGVGTCGDVWCGVANFALDYILPYLSNILQPFVLSFANNLACESCATTADCLQLPPNAASTCINGICKDAANTAQCVPTLLGIQGRLAPATLLGKFGVPPTAQLDLMVAGGANVAVGSGIDLGTRAGINAVGLANCVPKAPAPALPQLTAPNFDGDAPDGGNPYHVALGVSEPFMNLGLYAADQSGALCVGLTNAQFALISTGTFGAFLPSLGKLARRDGQDAPMLIALRPQTPPSVTVGAGTFDPVTKMPIDPLLTLSMPNLAIDFYAMFDGRYARLFTLTADLNVPLSLIFNGCSSVEAALGNVSNLITNVRTTPSEILAEDPALLGQIVPTLLGLAGPLLQSLLKPIALPAVLGLQLEVDSAKGIQPIAGTRNYNYLAIYARMFAAGQCAVGVPTTLARLAQAIIPPADRMHLGTGELPLPVAVLDVKMIGMSGTAEFGYRVDDGLWHAFQTADPAGQLQVSDPAFLLQGIHRIDVRSRSSDEPRGISAPVSVGFLVDWEPPEVFLTVDRPNNTIHVAAHDVVTADPGLSYSYAVGQDAASEFGPARPIDLAAVDAAGGLTVRVRDQAGNVGEATYRAATVAVRGTGSAAVSIPTAAEEGGGCSTAGGGPALWWAWSLAGGMWRRRRARS